MGGIIGSSGILQGFWRHPLQMARTRCISGMVAHSVDLDICHYTSGTPCLLPSHKQHTFPHPKQVQHHHILIPTIVIILHLTHVPCTGVPHYQVVI